MSDQTELSISKLVFKFKFNGKFSTEYTTVVNVVLKSHHTHDNNIPQWLFYGYLMMNKMHVSVST